MLTSTNRVGRGEDAYLFLSLTWLQHHNYLALGWLLPFLSEVLCVTVLFSSFPFYQFNNFIFYSQLKGYQRIWNASFTWSFIPDSFLPSCLSYLDIKEHDVFFFFLLYLFTLVIIHNWVTQWASYQEFMLILWLCLFP